MPIPKKYDRDFFKKWSSDMAYILGFIFADGNIIKTKRGTHFISLYSADRDILVAMQVTFGSNHKISERVSPTGSTYKIQVGSKEWFDDLALLNLVPHKLGRLKLPTIPDAFFADFIRGYFDGDGNVWTGLMNTKREKPTHSLQAVFTSCSIEFLEVLRKILQAKGLKGGSVYYYSSKKTYARFGLSTLDALKLYEIMYNSPCNLYLKRKRIVFDGFIHTRV